MQPMYYIGLDVHKQEVSYCVKDSSGKIYGEGWISDTRFDLDRWMKTLRANRRSGYCSGLVRMPRERNRSLQHPLVS